MSKHEVTWQDMEGRGLLVLQIHHHHWLYFSTHTKKERILNRIVIANVTLQKSDLLLDEIQEQGRTECCRFVIAMEQEGHEIWRL